MLGSAVAGGLLAVVHHVQTGRTVVLLLAKAETLASAGRHVEALAAVGKSLALWPSDGPALVRRAWLLDRTATNQADRARVLSAFQAVLQRQPGRADVRRRLAELLVGQGRYNDAHVHVGILVELNPGDAFLEELMGRCEDARGVAAEAARWYGLALRHGPRRRGAALRTAALGRGSLRDPARADHALDSLVAADPEAFDVWLARARYRRVYSLAGATEDLEKARNMAPDDAGVLLETAQTALANRDPDGAADTARRLIRQRPNDVDARLWSGEVLLISGRREEAACAFRRAVALAPGRPEPWVALVRLLARSGLDVEAAAAVAEAERTVPQAGGARARALGPCYEAVGRSESARSQYRRAVETNPDDPGLRRDAARFVRRHGPSEGVEPAFRALLARSDLSSADVRSARRAFAVWLARTGSPEKGSEALSLLENGGSNGPDDHRACARVLASLGGRKRRREAIALLADMDPSGMPNDDRILLASLHEAVGEWPRARALIADLAGSEALDTPGRIRLAEALLRHDEAGSAAPLVARVATDAPNDLSTIVLQARLRKAGGDGPGAADCLVKRARAHPAEASTIALMLERLGENAPAEALYRAVARSASRPESGLALAGFLARHGKADEAFGLCSRAWTNCRPEVSARVTATVFAATVEPSASAGVAVGRLEAAALAEGASVALVTSLASVREHQGRFDEAETLYRRALRRDPHDLIALNNLAVLIALRGPDRREAVDLGDRAVSQGGSLPELLDTRGLARLGTDDTAAAIDDLSEAVDVSPSGPIYFHLAQAHLHARDHQAAVDALRKAAALGLADRDLHPLERASYRRLLAEIASK